MNPLVIEGISAILSMIEALLPLILQSSDKAAQIDNIITALQKWLPIIGDQIVALSTGIKNIIFALAADPSTTPDQFAALQQLDAQTDAAFEAAAKAVDPDAAPFVP